MSASKDCPQCKGSGFRATGNGPAHQICECIEFDLADEDCGFGICDQCGLGFVDDSKICLQCDFKGWKERAT